MKNIYNYPITHNIPKIIRNPSKLELNQELVNGSNLEMSIDTKPYLSLHKTLNAKHKSQHNGQMLVQYVRLQTKTV